MSQKDKAQDSSLPRTLSLSVDTAQLGWLATTWTVAHQVPLSDFPGKIIAVGCHFLLPGNLPDPGIKLRSPMLQEAAIHGVAKSRTLLSD